METLNRSDLLMT